MLFNSFQFLAFILAVLAVYRLLERRRQNRFLLVASYVFYGSWDWRFLSLILASTVVDYFCALKIDNPKTSHRKRYLLLSVFFNLGLLGVFKYFNFFAASTVELLGVVGLQPSTVTLSVILPVGISFYTFQTLSYTIDVYQRRMRATTEFFDFALFVEFFPQLVAGPIERARRFLPQILAPRTPTIDGFQSGCYLAF